LHAVSSYPQKPNLRFQQDVSELQNLQLHEASRMIHNDPELFWRLAPNKRLPDDSWPFFGIISNGQSLREDHEIPRDKPTDETRILFLGDSCTFGYGVAHDATFVEAVESTLSDMKPGAVECINAGVPGYTIFQGYRYLATEGLRYQPDLVVLNFGWNDYGMWDQLGDVEHHAALRAMQPPPLLRSSRICQLIWAHLHKPPAPHPDTKKRPRMLPEEFADTLGKIYSLLEEQQIPMLILVWPMRANTEPETPPDARTSLQVEMTAFGLAHPLSTSPSVSGALDLVPLAQRLVREHGAKAIYFDQG
jgi:lysophospholipase L1-like esterase